MAGGNGDLQLKILKNIPVPLGSPQVSYLFNILQLNLFIFKNISIYVMKCNECNVMNVM